MVLASEDFCQRMVSGLHRDFRQLLNILAGISQSGADEFAFSSDIASIISLSVTFTSVMLEVLFFSVWILNINKLLGCLKRPTLSFHQSNPT